MALASFFSLSTGWLPPGPMRPLLEKGVYGAIALASVLIYGKLLPVLFAPAPAIVARTVRTRVQIVAGITCGLALAGLLDLILAFFPEGHDPAQSWQMIASGILASALEELLYRRGLQSYLSRWMPPVASVLVSSVCFAATHPMPGAFYVFFCGLVFGVLYWRSGLLSAILAHGAYNFAILASAPWA